MRPLPQDQEAALVDAGFSYQPMRRMWPGDQVVKVVDLAHEALAERVMESIIEQLDAGATLDEITSVEVDGRGQLGELGIRAEILTVVSRRYLLQDARAQIELQCEGGAVITGGAGAVQLVRAQAG